MTPKALKALRPSIAAPEMQLLRKCRAVIASELAALIDGERMPGQSDEQVIASRDTNPSVRRDMKYMRRLIENIDDLLPKRKPRRRA